MGDYRERQKGFCIRRIWLNTPWTEAAGVGEFILWFPFNIDRLQRCYISMYMRASHLLWYQ